MNKCTGIIVGYMNWDKYTRPLIDSLHLHWPGLPLIVVDNGSAPSYPEKYIGVKIIRSDNQSVSRALNVGIASAKPSEWYIKFDNDVICVGAFEHFVDDFSDDTIYSPEKTKWNVFQTPLGWAYFIPARIWDDVGQFDEQYLSWGFDETDYSYRAAQKGYKLEAKPELPFIHFEHGAWEYMVQPKINRNNQAKFLKKWRLKI